MQVLPEIRGDGQFISVNMLPMRRIFDLEEVMFFFCLFGFGFVFCLVLLCCCCCCCVFCVLCGWLVVFFVWFWGGLPILKVRLCISWRGIGYGPCRNLVFRSLMGLGVQVHAGGLVRSRLVKNNFDAQVCDFLER